MTEDQKTYRRVGKVPDAELLAAAETAVNMRQLLRALGIAEYGGNYASIRSRLARLGDVPPRLLPRRTRASAVRFAASQADLVEAVADARTKADILRALGYAADPRLYRRLNAEIEAAGIDTSHLIERGWSRGLTLPPRTALEDVLQAGSSVQSDTLRRRLLREGVFAHQCASCRRSEWNGRPIPLELDHIDGDRTNNEIGNLRLLCPNCHAQTDTYRGRNVGRPHGAADGDQPVIHEPLRPLALRRLASIVGAA